MVVVFSGEPPQAKERDFINWDQLQWGFSLSSSFSNFDAESLFVFFCGITNELPQKRNHTLFPIGVMLQMAIQLIK